MEELLVFQENLVRQVQSTWHRYLFPTLFKQERLIGIKGIRGTGKSTMLLQFLVSEQNNASKGLYITMEHPYFYSNSLFDLATQWYSYGGRLLLIDEVHKYPRWSRELKLVYDGFPDMTVIFTSSSALDLYRGESDLSRRLSTYTLHGLSFREYLSLIHSIDIKPIALNAILEDPRSISQTILEKLQPLPYFQQYIREGYFPFINDIDASNLSKRLFQVINTVLESDLSFIQDYSTANMIKIKNLLGVIAESAPFEPNISKLAQKMQLGRQTVNIFIKHLQDAGILNLLFKPGKGISQLQKPGKIYFENPNFVYAMQHTPSVGTIRETFFMNQLKNAGHQVSIADKGDFLVDNKWIFEVGGKNKDNSQLKGIDNGYFAIDDIEMGFGQKIPLWLFGFLY